MALTITLYVIIGLNLGGMFLAWEDRYGVNNFTHLKDRWSMFKNREHFGAQDYR